MNGYEYEEKCGEYLLKKGFTNVEVTPKSGDFGIDIIACKDGTKYGIQCKYYDKPVGNKAVQEAYAGSTYYKCDKPMVITNTTFTNQAKALAESLGVELWEDVNAIVLMEKLSMSSTDIVKRKIKEAKQFVEESYKNLQNYLDKNPIEGPDALITYVTTQNQCFNLMNETDKRLEKLKNTSPCSKVAILELLDLLETTHRLLVDLKTNPQCGNLRKIGFDNTNQMLVDKWENYSKSIPFLDEEKEEKELYEIQHKKMEEKREKQNVLTQERCKQNNTKNNYGMGILILFFIIITVLIFKSCGNSEIVASSTAQSYICRYSGCGRTAVYSDWNRRYCNVHIQEEHYCRYPGCMNLIPNSSTSRYCSEHD